MSGNGSCIQVLYKNVTLRARVFYTKIRALVKYHETRTTVPVRAIRVLCIAIQKLILFKDYEFCQFYHSFYVVSKYFNILFCQLSSLCIFMSYLHGKYEFSWMYGGQKILLYRHMHVKHEENCYFSARDCKVKISVQL